MSEELLSYRMRRLRESRGLRQEELGAALGVSARYIGMIERGQKDVEPSSSLYKLFSLLEQNKIPVEGRPGAEFPTAVDPVPETEEGLRRFIADIDMNLNGWDRDSGPFPENVREELSKKRGEAEKRLLEFKDEEEVAAGGTPPPPNELPVSSPPFQDPGNGIYLKREALVRQYCLDIDSYAQVIAEAYRAAADENDFVLALYGPWGRGKTTQMKEVGKILSGNNETKQLGHGYHCEFFSAWKYPTRPEVWVHLYQCLAKAAQDDGFWQKLRIGFRIGLLKKGWLPLWLGFGLLAFSQIQLEFGHWLLNGLGLIGSVILAGFVWNAAKLGKNLAQSYSGLPDHADKLGLQAVIGADLKSLLQVWVTGKPAESKTISASTPGPFRFSWGWGKNVIRYGFHWLLIVFAWFKGKPVPKAKQDRQSALCDFSLAWTRVKLFIVMILAGIALHLVQKKLILAASEAASPLSDAGEINVLSLMYNYILPALPGLALFTGIIVLAWQPKQFQHVLLIVDDLDRCEPDQMLAVIESIRVFLDDPEMSRRMQVAMLMDKELLEEALIKRYRDRKPKKAPVVLGGSIEKDYEETEEDISTSKGREQLHLGWQREKFFVIELTLPELSSKDVIAVAKKVIGDESQAQLDKKLEDAKTQASSIEGGAESSPSPQGGSPSPLTEGANPTHKPRPSELVDNHHAERELTSNSPQGNKNLLPQDSGPMQDTPLGMSTPLNTTFADWESKVLIEAIQIHFKEAATPRSIRAFVLRYQLARLLLQQLSHGTDMTMLADALAVALKGDRTKIRKDIPEALQWAVKHVI